MSEKSKTRGFAGMDKGRLIAISRNGGKRAHELGVAHEFDSTEAREAGRKGGMVSASRKRVSQ